MTARSQRYETRPRCNLLGDSNGHRLSEQSDSVLSHPYNPPKVGFRDILLQVPTKCKGLISGRQPKQQKADKKQLLAPSWSPRPLSATDPPYPRSRSPRLEARSPRAPAAATSRRTQLPMSEGCKDDERLNEPGGERALLRPEGPVVLAHPEVAEGCASSWGH